MTPPSIHTLVTDIQYLITRHDGWMSAYKDELGKAVADRLEAQFAKTHESKLRLSKMGPICPKHLWHSIHTPELAELLPPWAETKFSLGHIVEAYALTLAKAAGHRVEGEQDELELLGVKGHRDAVLDGVTVDVKSCSSRLFQKIKTGSIGHDDPFGYLDQLDGYVVAASEDALVTDRQHGYIIAIDKTLGHMCTYEHTVRPDRIRKRVVELRRVVSRDDPPACTCGTVNYGTSGNIALDTRASYSNFKYTCFPQLRCFLYASGPVYLTHVARKPDVPEIDRHGKVLYH